MDRSFHVRGSSACNQKQYEFPHHNDRDRNFHLFKHLAESGHDPVVKNDNIIIGKGYRNNTRKKKKIAQTHFVKKTKPFLNMKERHVKLKLLN